jgi:hypothetical protein
MNFCFFDSESNDTIGPKDGGSGTTPIKWWMNMTPPWAIG